MKWIKALVFSLVPVAGLAQEVEPEEIVLVATEIRDMDSCMEVLAEFNWICQEFNHSGWAHIYGYPYWDSASLLFYRHDLDGDGTIDGILKMEHVGMCSRGGPVCSHLFLFGDQPVTEFPHQFSLKLFGSPIVTLRENERGFVMDSNRSHFFSIREIRERTLESIMRQIYG